MANSSQPRRAPKPASGKPSTARAASGRPSAGKSSAGKPSGGKPSSGKPSSGKSSSGKSSSGKPSAGRPSAAKSSSPRGAASSSKSSTPAALKGRKPATARGAAPKPLPGKSMAATKAILAAEKKAAKAGGSGSGSAKRATDNGRGGPGSGGQNPNYREHPARRQRRRRTEANDELVRLAGKQSRKVLETLAEATDAFVAGRERDAMRMLRPLAERYPDAMGVRELMGLCHYRIGNFKAAIKELEVFADLSGSTEQHPVLMDCYRSQRQWKRVDECWKELAETSPSAELVTEGRIVMAGSLADRGRRDEAITLLEKRNAKAPRRVQLHHARLWYALADLHERAGNHPRARSLFQQVSKFDAQFADVAERLANLS